MRNATGEYFLEGGAQRRNLANCVLTGTADNRPILHKEVNMKSNNTVKEMPKNATTKGSTSNALPCDIKKRNNANEDREFINRMNAFTQITGLLTDDPFYEVL
ncbi:hypothetical protein [Kluyvera sichuanensis]|uniref:hypothetical protein n=1 Tax=Kluyvera sichuanensis TaxID=2725494 RepID=UPI0039F5D904